MYDKLKNWISKNNLRVNILKEDLLSITDTEFHYYILPFKDKLFDKHMFFILSDEETINLQKYREEHEKLNIVYEFGESFYYSSVNVKKDEYNDERFVITMNDFLYLGVCEGIKPDFPHIGIHSEYELLNVACNYEDVIKKAKFLGYQSLGICDKNTLAGTLGFQLKCVAQDIKAVLGETVSVVSKIDDNSSKQITHDVKLYAVNEIGWDNLMSINKRINVDHEGEFVLEKELLLRGKGLILVVDYSNSIFRNLKESDFREKLDLYKNAFEKVAFQFSSVRYTDQEYDKKCLIDFKFVLDNFKEEIDIVFIDDIYYLEQTNSNCKDLLNKIGGFVKQHSYNSHLKTIEEITTSILPLFKNSKHNAVEFLKSTFDNTEQLFRQCNFNIKFNENKTPKYEIEGKELSEQESVDLLRCICEEGFDKRILSEYKDQKTIKKYRDRLEMEFRVVCNALLSDYFLILWDILDFARSNKILVGPGRGSVGGSLLAYLTYITDIDPIKYDLMFERFLNEARITPDIFYVFEMENGKSLKYKEGVEVLTNRGLINVEEITENDEIL